mmetsp:Transcript_46414/g.140562  ORF Transcript_46414/g.140562 Transcript_46414/m.140562 type:complete len:349 (-) Transcript_46414:316-1362(-)
MASATTMRGRETVGSGEAAGGPLSPDALPTLASAFAMPLAPLPSLPPSSVVLPIVPSFSSSFRFFPFLSFIFFLAFCCFLLRAFSLPGCFPATSLTKRRCSPANLEFQYTLAKSRRKRHPSSRTSTSSSRSSPLGSRITASFSAASSAPASPPTSTFRASGLRARTSMGNVLYSFSIVPILFTTTSNPTFLSSTALPIKYRYGRASSRRLTCASRPMASNEDGTSLTDGGRIRRRIRSTVRWPYARAIEWVDLLTAGKGDPPSPPSPHSERRDAMAGSEYTSSVIVVPSLPAAAAAGTGTGGSNFNIRASFLSSARALPSAAAAAAASASSSGVSLYTSHILGLLMRT